jgi:rhomboid protease GluP
MQNWITKLKFYWNRYPITMILTVVNLIIYLLNHSGLIYPVIVYPGMINLYTFFGHFSHISLMHIGFNLLILWQIGPLIESRLSRIKFLFLIATLWLGLVGGGLLWLKTPSLGFSGIGLGLLAFTGLLYRSEKKFSQSLLKWVAFNVLIGLLPQISFLMHFLGALLGLGLGFVLKPDYEEVRLREIF